MAPSQRAEEVDRRICETTMHCGKPMFYQPWIKQGPDRLHYRAFAICLWCGEVQEF